MSAHAGPAAASAEAAQALDGGGCKLPAHTHTHTHTCVHTHRKLGTESVLNVPTSFFMLQYLWCKQAVRVSQAKLKSPAGKDKSREWPRLEVTILNTQTSSHQIKPYFYIRQILKPLS